MTHFLTSAQEAVFEGTIILATDDLRWLLVGNSTDATVASSTAAVLSDWSTLDEISDGNYTRQAMGARTVTPVYASNHVKVTTGAQLNFGAITNGIQVAAAVCYKHVTGVASTDKPVFVQNEGGLPKTTDGQSFLLQEPAGGWFQGTSDTAV